MQYQQEITKAVLEKLSNLGSDMDASKIASLLEVPKDPAMGDVAFPCFQLAKELKKAPPMIAQDLAKELEGAASSFSCSRVLAAGPYLNFTLDTSAIAADLIPSILNEGFLQPRTSTNLKTMVEYSQPNTHKVFHVGHIRNVALGDAISRILRWSGDEVIPSNYFGDVGTHIAKCLWKYQESGKKFDESAGISRAEFLGNFYVEAVNALDLSLVTRAPAMGLIAAKVNQIGEHPKNPKWQVVEVDTGSETTTVVCGGKGFKTGDLVAYAPLGTKVAGRLVVETDKKGVTSRGMICSEKEANYSDEKEKILVIQEAAKEGQEVVEIYRIPGALDDSLKIAEEFKKREQEVSKILQALEKGEAEITALWQETRKWSLDDFKEIYDWLGADFQHNFYESEVAAPGKKIVNEFLDKNVFEHSEGAVGISLDKYKLPFFLLLKSDGTGLYSTKDLALARTKFETYNIDKSIYVVDTSQSLHFQQVFATLQEMGYKQAENSYHLAYGMVVLPDGKMSSRKGNVIPYTALKKTLIDKITSDFLEEYRGDWPDDEINEAARRIAVGTIRYGMLNQDNNKNIVFDLKEWSARTGNTGPYLMYAYTRTRSILREVEKEFGPVGEANFSVLSHETEHEVLRKLLQFHRTVDNAYKKYEPQLLCIYLYELAKNFSRMYDQCSVLKAENEELRNTRAQLVDAIGRVLHLGLSLLGIETLERM